MADSPDAQRKQPQGPEQSGVSAAQQDFAPTVIEDQGQQAGSWWLEAVDGHCSQSAVLFAESQPAKLNVV